MNRLSIAHRLYIGLGLVVLLGLAMTLAALIGLSRIKGQWEAFEKGSLVRLDLVLDATRKLAAASMHSRMLCSAARIMNPRRSLRWRRSMKSPGVTKRSQFLRMRTKF